MAGLFNVADYAVAAREKVAPEVWCYFEGGAGDEVTLRGNAAAYDLSERAPGRARDVAEVRAAHGRRAGVHRRQRAPHGP